MVLFSSNVTRSPDTYLTTFSSNKKKTQIPYLVIIQGLKSFIATRSHFFDKHFGPFSLKHLHPGTLQKLVSREWPKAIFMEWGKGGLTRVWYVLRINLSSAILIFLQRKSCRIIMESLL